MPPRKPKSLVTRKQSGDDWGMGDDDDLFGTDIMNMDPDSPEFAAAVAADTAKGPPKIPGELDANNWSPDFTDSGIQTSYDPEDAEEDAYDNRRFSSQGKGQFAAGSYKAMNPVLRRGVEAKKSFKTLINQPANR